MRNGPNPAGFGPCSNPTRRVTASVCVHSLTLINRFSLFQTPFCCRIRDYIVRLTLVVGRSADDITTVSCLGQFLYKRDGADLHLITDIDYFIGQHMCTYTFLEDEDIDGYLLGSYERW